MFEVQEYHQGHTEQQQMGDISYNSFFQNHFHKSFSAGCPLKGHTYSNKPAAFHLLVDIRR